MYSEELTEEQNFEMQTTMKAMMQSSLITTHMQLFNISLEKSIMMEYLNTEKDVQIMRTICIKLYEREHEQHYYNLFKDVSALNRKLYTDTKRNENNQLEAFFDIETESIRKVIQEKISKHENGKQQAYLNVIDMYAKYIKYARFNQK